MTHRPVGVGASFNFSTGTTTTSSAFSVQSNTIRVVAVGAAAHIAVGGTPSATTADYFVPSGGTATLALTKASNRIVGVTTGTSTVLTCPEGTQLPFGVGDYVTLSGSTYHNFTSAEVLSVDTSLISTNSFKQFKDTFMQVTILAIWRLWRNHFHLF